MQYENKIRRYAQPDKVFRYFATIQACYPDGKKEDVYMTPDDFVRSLTPDGELQPQDCLLDRFRTVKTAHVSHKKYCLPKSNVHSDRRGTLKGVLSKY